MGSYGGFVKFSEDLRGILELFKKVTGLELSERLGLRYINLVREAPGVPFDTLLQPATAWPKRGGVLGLTETTNFYQVRGASDEGVLSVKLWQVKDGFLFTSRYRPYRCDNPVQT